MLLDDLFDRSIPEPNTGCWLWLGTYSSEGYGTIQEDGETKYAHRKSFQASKGPIPNGLDLDHLCRVRCCINPDHLEPVTRGENFRRGEGPAARNARKTHCKNGHQLKPPNLYFSKIGKRVCRICANQRLRNLRNKKGKR